MKYAKCDINGFDIQYLSLSICSTKLVKSGQQRKWHKSSFSPEKLRDATLPSKVNFENTLF